MATGGEVPCALGCVAWLVVRDAGWKFPVSASDVHPDENRDGQFRVASDGQTTSATGEMTGGEQRIDFGAYTFALAYSSWDDTKPRTFPQTTYLCQQRVNVPADATAVIVRAHFGPDCAIEAEIELP